MIRGVFTVVIAAGLIFPMGGKAYRKTEEGNRAYDEERFEEALRAYTEAQVDAPEAPELHYDIGNVLYRQGDFTGAAEAFTRALLSAEPSLVPRAAYNLGNALFQEGRYDEAVRAYRRSLEADPADPDAKRNLELALRALEQQQQQPQDRQSESEGGEENEEQPQPQPSPEPSGEEGEGDEPEPQPQPRQGEMSQEEAERLLDGLSEEERENLKRQLARQAPRESRAEEDW